jgi:hypothetical protein
MILREKNKDFFAWSLTKENATCALHTQNAHLIQIIIKSSKSDSVGQKIVALG